MLYKNLIHKIIRRLFLLYQKTEEKYYNDIIASNGGVIEYPALIHHGEMIQIGQETTIMGNSRICLYPERVKKKDFKIIIGSHCFFGYRLCILAGDNIRIGDNVIVASDVSIISENHGIDPLSKIPYMDQELVANSINIGNNCWIGDKVTILQGVTIGNGVVIGAGSVVTHSIPDYSIAVGNPAYVIKRYDRKKCRWIGV